MAKTETTESAVIGFAEDLGNLLGSAEKKASEWLNQKQAAVDALTSIRDRANSLLEQLGVAEVPFPRKRGRPPGSVKTAKKGRKRGGMSPETRAKMAAAAKKRWAAKKKAEA